MLGYRLKLIFRAILGIFLAASSWVSVFMIIKTCEITGAMFAVIIFIVGIAMLMSKYAYNAIERLIKEWE